MGYYFFLKYWNAGPFTQGKIWALSQENLKLQFKRPLLGHTLSTFREDCFMYLIFPTAYHLHESQELLPGVSGPVGMRNSNLSGEDLWVTVDC